MISPAAVTGLCRTSTRRVLAILGVAWELMPLLALANPDAAAKAPAPRVAEQVAEQPATREQELELEADVQQLRDARDSNSLMLLCDSRRAQQIWDERTLYLTWQALCRGHVYLIRGEWSHARNSYEKVFHQVNALPAQWRQLARQFAARAQFAVGSSYRDELSEAGTCLAQLGSKELAAFEAGRRANLRAAALQAYRDVARYDRERVFLEALLEINLLSDRLYREATRPTMSWRALQPPPPLRNRGVPRTPLIRSILGPQHSSLRREVLLTYGKLVRRSRRLDDDSPLRQRILQAQQAFQDYQPRVEDPVVVNWPERPLRSSHLLKLTRDKNEFEVTTSQGAQRWDSERALTELRGILASAPEGRWAPRAVVELANLGDSSLMPTLVELISHDQDPELQIAAVYAIGRIGDASTIGALLDTYARARAKSDRELFTSAADAMYGLEENLLRSLGALGAREPRLFENLLDDRRLGRREAAYVLWRASAKRLYGLYVRMRDDRDTWVKAYGLMALVELQGDTTRWMLVPQSSDDDLLRCVRSQLRYSLEASP